MLRFWGQAKFSPSSGRILGFELFLRELDLETNRWQVPQDFSVFAPSIVVTLLTETLRTLPAGLELVSINLDQEQFIDPEFSRLLAELAVNLPFKLVVELTERKGHGVRKIAVADLVRSAKRFSTNGLAVCLDDVGTGENQLDLVQILDPYVSEYKYALQNVRGSLTTAVIFDELQLWQRRARNQNKFLAIEGFEEVSDVALIDALQPDVVQGYLYAKPHLFPMKADFHLMSTDATQE
jgi:EAL domain-containing protein (putative c-di-GMP-specific phosphodiesterase class I)